MMKMKKTVIMLCNWVIAEWKPYVSVSSFLLFLYAYLTKSIFCNVRYLGISFMVAEQSSGTNLETEIVGLMKFTRVCEMGVSQKDGSGKLLKCRVRGVFMRTGEHMSDMRSIRSEKYSYAEDIDACA